MSPVTDLRCIVTVGTGRGFIVADEYHYYVITAAHCLPDGLPPCYSASALEQRIYKNLLGRLGSEPEVCAECLFADPIADIAVLGSPDNQALSAEAEKYQALMSAARVLTVANTPERGSAWLLSLNCNWFHCIVSHFGGPLWIEEGSRRHRRWNVRISHNRCRWIGYRG